MLTLQPKQVKVFLLFSICICGLSAGFFAAQLAGFFIRPPATLMADKNVSKRQAPRPSGVDTGLILNNNIFDPASRGKTAEPVRSERQEPVATVTNSSLKLFGTVDGGDNPLALIESDGQVKIFRVGASLPGGGELLAVARNEAVIRQADGSQAKLTIIKPELTSTPVTEQTSSGEGIRNLGNNRWSISRDEVEKARTNLNQLLKSARLEPNIINGQTEGFVVKMIRPKSLLAELGIQRGDTVTRVNGVELNSPEKALQIFQQLREAKRLTVDLKRGSDKLTFDYEVN